MRALHLAFAGLLIAFAACSAKGALEAAAKSVGEGDQLSAFITDKFMMKGAELKAKYPEGKPFEIKTKAKENGGCGSAQCSISLGGASASMLFELAADQKQVAEIKAGDAVSLKCTPVYEGDSLQISKSCTVAKI